MPAYTVPLLPCESIDEIAEFYALFGAEITYKQHKPYSALALMLDGVGFQYFGMPGFKPEESYGSCLLMVDDTQPWFDLFAAGLRTAYGKLPITGFPRITRPRIRKNAGNLSGFSLIDPAGNWIRVFRSGEAVEVESRGRLGDALANAVVLADSKDDPAQALKILRGAHSRAAADTDPQLMREVDEFLAELVERVEEA